MLSRRRLAASAARFPLPDGILAASPALAEGALDFARQGDLPEIAIRSLALKPVTRQPILDF